MIVYDLKCGAGHVFEAWFGSSFDYEKQRKKGLLECPLCGDASVEKAVMAPAVAAKSNQKPDQPGLGAQPMGAPGPQSPEEVKQMLAKLAEMQRQVEETFDYVGEDFAEEARRIHFGEVEERSIYGEVNLTEAKELREEGINVMPLPFPSRRKRLNT
ncbi:DUF1178 family protein [Pedomonas mirosovicensis]|uniref:DUF1178 family protein n=1 Tax=Pedomonas mirosovicensis TaxID=2908641 RepID=UPI002167F61D|nr:DUF1178 family protein [Pedomonas mirosovicensis]MCH8685781.1 DUF1178 family protein [Pedomonas mirosovicensis]